MSAICSLASLLALVGLSAMTIVPHPGAEHSRDVMMLIAGAFMLGWLSLAFWVLRRNRITSKPSPPPWFRVSLLSFGVIYLLAVFLLVLG